MENWKEIYEEIKKNGAKRSKLKEKQRSAPTHLEEAKIGEKITYIEVLNKVLHDKMRRAYAEEYLPKVLDILNSAEGKKFGPKMKAALQDKAKEIGLSFYMETGRFIALVPLDERGFSGGPPFFYNELNFYTKACLSLLDDDNKIVRREPSDFVLENCGDYYDDPAACARVLMRDFKKIREKTEELRSAVRRFNKMKPSGIDEVREPSICYYMI